MLIGIIGKKYSGKTTCADYITSKYDFITTSFADPLKQACAALFMLDDEQLYGDKKEIADEKWFDVSPRQIMQFVGTDLLRDNMHKLIPDLGSNIFVYRFGLWYHKLRQSDTKINVIISDVRFKNEAYAIRQAGGILVKIIRPTVKQHRSLLQKLKSKFRSNDTSQHISEKELDKIIYDILIINDSDLVNLYEKIDILIPDIIACSKKEKSM